MGALLQKPPTSAEPITSIKYQPMTPNEAFIESLRASDGQPRFPSPSFVNSNVREQETEKPPNNNPQKKGKYHASDEWKFAGWIVTGSLALIFYFWWAFIGNFAEHLNDPLFKYGCLPTFVLWAGLSMFVTCKIPFGKGWVFSGWLAFFLVVVLGFSIFFAYSRGDASMFLTNHRAKVILATIVTIIFVPPCIFLWYQALRSAAVGSDSKPSIQSPEKISPSIDVHAATIPTPLATAAPTTQPSNPTPTTTPSTVPVKPVTQPLTLKELFDTDFPTGSVSNELTMKSAKDGTVFKIPYRVVTDFTARTKFIAFYVPSSANTFDICCALPQQIQTVFDAVEKSIEITATDPGNAPTSLKELVFTGRIFIYCEDSLSHQQLATIQSVFSQNKAEVQFRDQTYWILHCNDKRELPDRSAPELPPLNPTPTTKLSDGRTIVNVSAGYLCGLFNGQLNNKGQKLVAPFIGKMIKISGTVQEILDSSTQIAVFVKENASDVVVDLYFSVNWRDKIDIVKKGDNITVVGEIESVRHAHGMDLIKCELTDS